MIKPAHPIRPGSVITTNFGHDIDPIENIYRFHRGIDRAGGDGLVYVPSAPNKAIVENPSTSSYGTLIRLIYKAGDSVFEIRIAHCVDFNPEFVTLAKTGGLIPAGMVMAHEGSVGKSTGPHSHIELIAIGERNKCLDEYLVGYGGKPGSVFESDDLDEIDKTSYEKWRGDYAVTHLGFHECRAWDQRTGKYAIWMNPEILGL
ncbi:MAG: hypothetical protein LBU99_01635 [Spirochaetaceae bacterium]|nr:hypothetical protein [Spirochaetaceae bacterium]